MKPIAENLEIKKNNFSKWLYLGFVVLGLLAFFITVNKAGNDKWICLGGALFFGSGYWLVARDKIITRQDGFTLQSSFRSVNVSWKDITALSYETAYHMHDVQIMLVIVYGNPPKRLDLPVKQFKSQPMQRFFEILNEQCPLAIKNDSFIKRATGAMNWKDKLKMY